MLASDLLHETTLALTGNKVRSGLTMLGIIIGIASVIAMVAIGTGAQGTITSNIQSLGSNLITVMPGAQRSSSGFSGGQGSMQSLTMDDAAAIADTLPSAQAVSPEVSSRYQVTAKGTNTNTQVYGVTPAYATVRSVAVSDGVFISSQDVNSASKVAVLGPSARDDLFGEGASAVGQSIRVNGVSFKVIGITAEKGGSGFSNPDDMVFVPVSTAQRFLTGNKYLTTISVQGASAETLDALQEELTALLLGRHNISNPDEADFRTLNQADIAATASSVASTFTTLLGAVAGISLLVGGIGIMNMMLTTVTERTREIGLRKAIGAKRRDINYQFLMEAVLLTFLGGLIGVILGWLAAWGVTKFGGIATTVSPQSILMAFGVAAGIGIVFGYYPAQRASHLNPIVALRYE